jgi:hypothetical protein
MLMLSKHNAQLRSELPHIFLVRLNRNSPIQTMFSSLSRNKRHDVRVQLDLLLGGGYDCLGVADKNEDAKVKKH